MSDVNPGLKLHAHTRRMQYQGYNIIACTESNCEKETSESPRTNKTIIKRYQTKQYKLDKWSNKVEKLFFSQQCWYRCK